MPIPIQYLQQFKDTPPTDLGEPLGEVCSEILRCTNCYHECFKQCTHLQRYMQGKKLHIAVNIIEQALNIEIPDDKSTQTQGLWIFIDDVDQATIHDQTAENAKLTLTLGYIHLPQHNITKQNDQAATITIENPTPKLHQTHQALLDTLKKHGYITIYTIVTIKNEARI